MEPMTLGSPVQSPVHLGVPPSFSGFQSPVPSQPAFHSTMLGSGSTPLGGGPFMQSPAPGTPMQPGNPGQPGFLPGYLMGQFPQQSSNRVMSPTKLNRSMSNMSNSNAVTTPSGAPIRQNGFLTPTTPASHMRTPSEKPGGPPIKGLYTNTPKHNRGTPRSGYGITPGHTPLNSTPQLSFGATPNSSGFRDQDLVDGGGCNEGTTWVTIFGFPPSASSYILSQFSQCGTILQHFIPPNGNWMTIRFQTKMQAQKALGRSGRVFGGTLMIGVAPCHDPPAEATNVSNILDQTGGHHHPADSSVLSLNSSLAPHNRSIRPLTQSYKAAHNEHEISAIANTPNKNSGIVGRAMEYIFGW